MYTNECDLKAAGDINIVIEMYLLNNVEGMRDRYGEKYWM